MRWSPGKIWFRPNRPAADFLILGQRLICPFDSRRRVRAGATHHQDRIRFGVAAAFKADYNAVSNARLTLQRLFQVFRVNVHARRRNDDILPPALEVQAAILVLLGDVSRSEPSIRSR